MCASKNSEEENQSVNNSLQNCWYNSPGNTGSGNHFIFKKKQHCQQMTYQSKVMNIMNSMIIKNIMNIMNLTNNKNFNIVMVIMNYKNIINIIIIRPLEML